MLDVLGKINSHNEWDKLKEIIVGTAAGTTATLSWMRPGAVPEGLMDKASEISAKACPKWFFDEVEEDLQALAKHLAAPRGKSDPSYAIRPRRNVWYTFLEIQQQ